MVRLAPIQPALRSAKSRAEYPSASRAPRPGMNMPLNQLMTLSERMRESHWPRV